MRGWVSALVLAMACSADQVSNPSGSIDDPIFRYGPPTGGGEETTLGNNLSVPVRFAEGYGITGSAIDQASVATTGLRTPAGATYATLADYAISSTAPVVTLSNGSPGYCQQTDHSWMAQWDVGATNAVVDWGDNLNSQTFTANSIIRVETTLLAPTSLAGYNMYLFGSGTRKDEMQCTDLTENPFIQTVYSVAPRLRIWKVSGNGVSPGATDLPLINLAVVDKYGQDGPGYYGAEINVAGKLIYGYNWFLRQLDIPTKTGWYLISFYLEPTVTIGTQSVNNGVTLTSVVDTENTALSGNEAKIWVEVKAKRDKGPRTQERGLLD